MLTEDKDLKKKKNAETPWILRFRRQTKNKSGDRQAHESPHQVSVAAAAEKAQQHQEQIDKIQVQGKSTDD